MSSRIDLPRAAFPAPSSTLPFLSCLLFSPSHVRHRRSSYRRSVRFQHGRFRCGYRIPDHADCDEPHQFPCHGNDSPFGTEDRSKKPSEGGKIAGASLILFALIGIAFSLLLTLGAAPLSRAMNAPEAAF